MLVCFMFISSEKDTCENLVAAVQQASISGIDCKAQQKAFAARQERVVPRSNRKCVFTKRFLRSENAGFPKSRRVIARMMAGAAAGISGRVAFASCWTKPLTRRKNPLALKL
jgi:hypothetical protein